MKRGFFLIFGLLKNKILIMKTFKNILGIFAVSSICISSFAQTQGTPPAKKETQIKWTVTKEVKATCVKDQYHSGTCWIFSTESFMESEFMRMGKGSLDLSEMWIVRAGYIEK